ncbi:MAG: hypothetical protein HYR85_01780 [Planctomycetes bacterium]|nr:hypothetical protein [Planctomycetota bacterium]
MIGIRKTTWVVLLLVALCPSMASARQVCGEWTPGLFPLAGTDQEVLALAEFDDGRGPALYAGGRFTLAGSAHANRIARWDGQSWSALSAGVNGLVRALASFDDGNGLGLYAAGDFSAAGGGSANHVARWDGQMWSPLAGGLNGAVFALATFDDGSAPALFAGGAFTSIDGGPAASYVARWNGHAWSAVGGGFDAPVHSLFAFDDGSGPGLFAGGEFQSAGGSPAAHIARFDGQSWNPLGSGTDDRVLSFVSFDDGTGSALYVGGNFGTAGHLTTGAVARWNGSNWSRPVTDVDALVVNSMSVFDDGAGPAVFAAGCFEFADPHVGRCDSIVKWEGNSWVRIGPEGITSSPGFETLVTFDDGDGLALFAGGLIDPFHHVARFDGRSWRAGGGMDSAVLALRTRDPGSGRQLLAGGTFVTAGNRQMLHIASWNGSSWSPVGGGIDVGYSVNALAEYDDGSGVALYAGGIFTSAGGTAVSNIARWNGSAWSDVGGGVVGNNATVGALVVFDDGMGPALYAAGRFQTAGGVTVNHIAKWDGVRWSPLGAGLSGGNVLRIAVSSLAVFDDGGGPALYAGGFFWFADGTPVYNIAKWDGSSWSSLGTGVQRNGNVNALAVFDDGSGPALHVGGAFTVANDRLAGNIARWSASGWSYLGSGVSAPNSTAGVTSMVAFDDGSGPALVVSGFIATAGGIAVDNMARWTRSGWSAFASGPLLGATTMCAFDDGSGSVLFAGQKFFEIGGTPSAFLGRWQPAPRGGNVIGATGSSTDVLFVNGSAGDAERAVSVHVGDPIDVRLDRAPSGPEPANYALWAWPGLPRRATAAIVGGTPIGCTVNPSPLAGVESPQPALCGLGGLGPEFCSSARLIRLPRRAPWEATREHGLARHATLTLQGMIENAGATNSAGLSVTNAVVLRVQ